MVFETILHSDLQKLVQVEQLTGNLFSADNGGNKITVEILDGGVPATVNGSVYGYVIREDGKTVVIEGSLSGNRASITLPTSAYAVIGWIDVVIKVGNTTAGACRAYVYRTTTDVIVDPGSVVPDISELLAIIGDCEAATAAAEAAATAAGYVNVTSSKSGKVITIVTTNRNNQSTSTTITEPTMTVSESGGVVTVTCTDADGTTTVSFDATDIDDTAGAGDTDKIWSADKSVKELQKKADLIEVTDTTAEAVKTITDGADNLPMELLIGIEPVQDLHGQEYPYPGGAGKNRYDKDATDTSNGYVNGKILGSDGAENTPGSPQWWEISEYIEVSPSTAYVISGQRNLSASGTVYLCEYDSSKNFVKSNDDSFASVTFTTDQNTKYVRLTCEKGQNATRQLETGSTATPYAPYSNICPISGWTGMNVYDGNENKYNSANTTALTNATVTLIDKTTITVARTGSGKTYVSSKQLLSNYNLIEGKKYILKSKISSKTGDAYPIMTIRNSSNGITERYDFVDNNSDEGYFVFTYNSANHNYISFFATYDTSATGSVTYTDIVLSEVKEKSITFPSPTPGTVYGGTLKINKDGTGTLTVDRVSTALGAADQIRTSSQAGTGKYVLYALTGAYYNASVVSVICEKFRVFAHNDTTYRSAWTANCFQNSGICYLGVFVPDGYTTDDADDVIEGSQVVYRLASASIYNLTAEEVGIITSLYGINNIWADTGDMLSITYPADTKLYVDKDNAQQDAEISATKGIIADSMTGTASRLIIVGELFIMNNTLYRATTNIANGATITPNTNCVATSIADEIGEYSGTTLASGIIHYQYGRCHRLFIGGYVEFPNMVFVYPTVAEVESAIQTLGISWEVMYQHITINHKYVGYVGQAITSSDAFQIVYLDGTTESLPSSSATVTGNLIWFE